jgi:hypothetical protein
MHIPKELRLPSTVLCFLQPILYDLFCICSIDKSFRSELFQFLESPFLTVPARGLYSIDPALLKGVDEPGPALPRPPLRSGALPSEIQICSDPRLPAPFNKRHLAYHEVDAQCPNSLCL